MLLMPRDPKGEAWGGGSRRADKYINGGRHMKDSNQHYLAIRKQLRADLASRILVLADEHLSGVDSQRIREWARAESNYVVYQAHGVCQRNFDRWLARSLKTLTGLIEDDPECQRILSSNFTGIRVDDRHRADDDWPSTALDPKLRAWLIKDEERERVRIHNERKLKAFKDGKCQQCFREKAGHNGICVACARHNARVERRRQCA